MSLPAFLAQQLSPITFDSNATPSTAKHAAPTWQFKVWDLNVDAIMKEVAAQKPSSGAPKRRLAELPTREGYIESEIGIKAALDPAMSAVTSALLRVGHNGRGWVLEATVASAIAAAAAAAASSAAAAAGTSTTAAATGAADVANVKGMFGKKPDFELFDRARRIRSFVEVKIPWVVWCVHT